MVSLNLKKSAIFNAWFAESIKRRKYHTPLMIIAQKVGSFSVTYATAVFVS